MDNYDSAQTKIRKISQEIDSSFTCDFAPQLCDFLNESQSLLSQKSEEIDYFDEQFKGARQQINDIVNMMNEKPETISYGSYTK